MPIAPSPLPRARKRLQQENAHVSLTSREKEKSMECNRQHGLTHEEGVTTVAPAMGRDGRREGRWRFLRRTGTEFFALFVMVAVVPVLLGRFQGGERATSESAQAKWSDREQGQRFADVLPKREGFEARDALVRGKADQLVVELRRPSPEAVALVQEIVEVVFPMPEKSLIAIGGAEDAERLEALRSVERVSPLPAKAKMGVPTEASSSGNGDNATTTNLIASLPPRMPGGMEARATDVHQAAKVVASSLGCSRGNGGIDEPAANGGSGLCEGVQADGKRSLTIVGVPPRSLLRAATELSALAVVHFVSLPGRLRALETENVQVAGAAQSGEESEHPLWDEGLDGEGEIIAIGDTGLDTLNCYFYDPVHTIESGDHRKVAFYQDVAGGGIGDQSGHGTHVAGTAAGEMDNGDGTEIGTGVAKGARIGVTDLQGEDSGDAFSLPVSGGKNLKENYLDPQEDAGARVSSNSWGSSLIEYDELSQDADWYAWSAEHEKGTGGMLLVFAAGNEGFWSFTSVGAPGNAKSVVSVGASLGLGHSIDKEVAQLPDDFAGNDAERVLDASFPDLRFLPRAGVLAHRGYSASTTPFKVDGATEHDLEMADPASACSEVKPPSSESGNPAIALVSARQALGNCSTNDMASNAEKANFDGILIANDLKACGTADLDAPDSSIGVASIPRIAAKTLRANLEDSSSSPIRFTLSRRQPGTVGWKSGGAIADFSSKGSTWDIRTKPDILAPGVEIVSAEAASNASREHCGTVELTGTSMATPAVSGAAAIVRQSLREKHGIGDPPPSLVRALLLNGARDLGGFSRVPENEFAPAEGPYVRRPTEEPDGCEQGFGFTSLPGATGEGAKADSPSSIIRVSSRGMGDVKLNQTGEVFTLCVDVKGRSEPLKATLAWSDLPGPLPSSLKLVNDLDLKVTLPDGSQWPQASPDSLNTAERMVLEEPPTGSYSVTVTAHRLFVSQAFSLVVSGDVEEADACDGGVDSRSITGSPRGAPPPPDYERFEIEDGGLDFIGGGSFAGRPSLAPASLICLAPFLLLLPPHP